MIEISYENSLATVELNHGKVNAMDLEFCSGLITALLELEASDCKAVILASKKPTFSAGIDLKRWLQEGSDYVQPFMLEMEKLFENVFKYSKPIIAAINGPAIAGGCMLAAACDYRLIADNAKMGILESRLGVPLPMMAIEIMRHVAHPNAFRRIISVGATFVGHEAVDAGLADQCTQSGDLKASTKQAVEDLAAVPVAAFQMTKQQRTSPVLRIVQQNREQLMDRYLEIWNSDQTRVAIRQYVDERLR